MPVELTVTDAAGRAVVRRRWNGTSLQLRGLAAGMHAIQVRTSQDTFVRKVLVE